MLNEANLDEYVAHAWEQNPKLALTFVDVQHFRSAIEANLDATTRSALKVANVLDRFNADHGEDAEERLTYVRNPAAATKLSRMVDYSHGRLTIWLYGTVIQETVLEFLDALAKHPQTPIVLRICCAGGDATLGLELAERLSRSKARTVAIVDGFAFSAGADIAMACDRLLVRKNATLLIHLTRKVCLGNADEILNKVAALRSTDQRAAGLCARKRRINAPRLYELARKETYLSAEQALAEGIADAVIPALPIFTEMR